MASSVGAVRDLTIVIAPGILSRDIVDPAKILVCRYAKVKMSREVEKEGKVKARLEIDHRSKGKDGLPEGLSAKQNRKPDGRGASLVLINSMD